MRAATLFSGIGAPEVAMPDWEWLWHAEIEPFPSAVMRVRHPQSVNLGDVTADDFCERACRCGRPDVLVFGSPCQSFSVAGKRLGLDDPRGNLALVALGIIARLEPAWFVFENVPGLLSSDDGRDFGLFLRTVDELRYHLCGRVLDAQYFGVAQRRRRLFAVGHARDWRRASAVLLEPESLCGHPPAREEARQDTTGTLAARTSAGGGLGTDFDLDGGLVARALTSSNQRIDYETETLNGNSADGFDASEDGTGRGTPIVAQPLTTGDDGSRGWNDPTNATLVPVAFTMKDYGADAGELAPTLRSGGHDKSHANGGVMPAIAFGWQNSPSQSSSVSEHITPTLDKSKTPAVAFAENQRGEIVVNDTLGALKVGGGKPGQGYPAVHQSGVRRLMPIECERLQGFPDHYTAITYRGKSAKDGPRYKAIGNSMAVPVIRWILERIQFVDGLQ